MATVVKVFAGEYDLTHQPQLRAEFDALRAENSLVLDMSAVTYLDSIFIGELIRLHNLRTAQGCDRLTIVHPSPIVKRVLSLLYIFTFCRVVASRDEALAQAGTSVVVRRACSGYNPVWRRFRRVLRTDIAKRAWISSVLSAVDI